MKNIPNGKQEQPFFDSHGSRTIFCWTDGAIVIAEEQPAKVLDAPGRLPVMRELVSRDVFNMPEVGVLRVEEQDALANMHRLFGVYEECHLLFGKKGVEKFSGMYEGVFVVDEVPFVMPTNDLKVAGLGLKGGRALNPKLLNLALYALLDPFVKVYALPDPKTPIFLRGVSHPSEFAVLMPCLTKAERTEGKRRG